MLLFIDNYDSFTYNLVHYFGELGSRAEVYRNDALNVDEALALKPEAIVLSPGPCTPNEAGICVELVRKAGADIPILGVCLGHQSIGQAFGGVIKRADNIMHGKTSPVRHANRNIFHDLPQNFTATRYHSLVVERKTLPDCLEITAETEDGAIMGLAHKQHRIYGVQFHPESIRTEYGHKLLGNFLKLAEARHEPA